MDRTEQEVPVFVLENDVAAATITPQWGGKVWDFRLKASGQRSDSKPLLFTNPIHQSVNSGVLKACASAAVHFLPLPG